MPFKWTQVEGVRKRHEEARSSRTGLVNFKRRGERSSPEPQTEITCERGEQDAGDSNQETDEFFFFWPATVTGTS